MMGVSDCTGESVRLQPPQGILMLTKVTQSPLRVHYPSANNLPGNLGDIFCRYVLHNVLIADTKTIFKKESVFICNMPLGEIGDTSSYEYLQGTAWLTCCGGDGKKLVLLLPGEDRDKTEVGRAEEEEESPPMGNVQLGVVFLRHLSQFRIPTIILMLEASLSLRAQKLPRGQKLLWKPRKAQKSMPGSVCRENKEDLIGWHAAQGERVGDIQNQDILKFIYF